MKMDVEGHEYQALKGASKALQEKYIRVIHIEVFPTLLKGAGTNPLDLFNYLLRKGYKV